MKVVRREHGKVVFLWDATQDDYEKFCILPFKGRWIEKDPFFDFWQTDVSVFYGRGGTCVNFDKVLGLKITIEPVVDVEELKKLRTRGG